MNDHLIDQWWAARPQVAARNYSRRPWGLQPAGEGALPQQPVRRALVHDRQGTFNQKIA
ncbi:hypothetical protein [Streptomyces sp. NPDC056663]|uniref:hypothetical protein n=1 Tax=unclassified Streptomyces TaxID=2593676 RepID=UPI00363E709B